MRVDRARRSAKGTIEQFATELLSRANDQDTASKLVAIQTIALRMGWNELYNKLRFRAGQTDTTDKWWNK